MKKWLLLFFVFFFGFIFSLKLQSSSVPNIFAIEAIIVVIAYLLQIILRIIVAFNIKGKAEKTYKCAFKYKSVFKLIFSVFPKHLSLYSEDRALNLIIIFVQRRYVKYHFASKTSVEVYRGNRETYRTGKNQYSIGKNVSWKLVCGIKISCNENNKTIFILTKTPMDVTSSDKTANEYLENGDAIFEDCVVSSKKYYMKKNQTAEQKGEF